MHRLARDLLVLEQHLAPVGFDDAHDHVEGGGFAGAVGAEQADNLPGFDPDGDAVDDAPAAVGF